MWKIIIYASSAVLIVILFIIIIYLYVNQDSDEDERLLEDNPPQDSSTVSGFPLMKIALVSSVKFPMWPVTIVRLP